MNARDRLSKLIYSIAVADGWEDAPTHIEDFRAIDAIVANYCAMIDEYSSYKPEVVTHSMRKLRADCKALGYSPEAPRD